jgi:hypothetical protein
VCFQQNQSASTLALDLVMMPSSGVAIFSTYLSASYTTVFFNGSESSKGKGREPAPRKIY